jgi:hypothetical protein
VRQLPVGVLSRRGGPANMFLPAFAAVAKAMPKPSIADCCRVQNQQPNYVLALVSYLKQFLSLYCELGVSEDPDPVIPGTMRRAGRTDEGGVQQSAPPVCCRLPCWLLQVGGKASCRHMSKALTDSHY